jgi:hypothetical protein
MEAVIEREETDSNLQHTTYTQRERFTELKGIGINIWTDIDRREKRSKEKRKRERFPAKTIHSFK